MLMTSSGVLLVALVAIVVLILVWRPGSTNNGVTVNLSGK